MQLLNNFQANVNLSRNKKIGIAIGSFIIITIIVLFVSFLGKDSQNKTDVYYDPASKETIDEQADKTPEILEDNVSTEPVFLGFGKLIEYGLSQDQLTNLKNAFNTYLGEGNNSKREVSIYIDSISSYKVNDVVDSDFGLSFDVIIDRKTNLSAIMYQLKVSDIQLKLYKEGSDKAVFDSGIVTSSSDPNTEDLVD